jgi:hypothetical protein
VIQPSELISPRLVEWAPRIRAEMAKGVQAVIATGRALMECKADLAHWEFMEVRGPRLLSQRE